MYILIAALFSSVDFALITDEGEVIYNDSCHVSDWNNARQLTTQLQETFLQKLRTHGKVATKIGIVLPFSHREHTRPSKASSVLFKMLSTSQLRTQILLPSVKIYDVVKQQWPHIPHYFLSDTHLSAQIERHHILPPFDYETQKSQNIHPLVVHSYGHKANEAKFKKTTPTISLYVGRQVSMALFEGGDIVDAHVSYGPYSTFLGPNNPPSFDASFLLELAEKKKAPELHTFITKHSGLQSILEHKGTIDEWLSRAGLAPRSSMHEDLPIEAIEWSELSVRMFIRDIRHGIGALITSASKMPQVVVNTSVVPQSSALWSHVIKGTIGELPVTYSNTSLLQAAALDLHTADD